MLQTTVCLANLGSSLPRKGFLRGDVCAGQTNSFNSVNLGSGLPRTRFLKGSLGVLCKLGGGSVATRGWSQTGRYTTYAQ